MTLTFDADRKTIVGDLFAFSDLAPLVDGRPLPAQPCRTEPIPGGRLLTWPCAEPIPGNAFHLAVRPCVLPEGHQGLELRYWIDGLPAGAAVDAFGLSIGRADDVASYLRSGYQSWDGTCYVPVGAPLPDGPDGTGGAGYALSQFLPKRGAGSAVLGFLRHDRAQHRFTFAHHGGSLSLTVETLWDLARHQGVVESEALVLFEHPEVEDALRLWARAVAMALPQAPRAIGRITGWCSWYNLYAAIDEAVIREHLAAAQEVARADSLPMRVFQIDDGFTPEMGDWLEVKPQFPRGMKPILDEIRDAGFLPGLWIAPFLVGNRSRLYREHPDWVVRDAATGGPLATMTFYGEFRWHKRSEEYYVLDVTNPEAEAYLRHAFRTWREDWGCGYFKTDFMHAGSAYGPDRAAWHLQGLTRIEVWMRMARLIREEIGEAVWLGCGCPLWAPAGLVDAVRIGRDMGVEWGGERPADTLLRDQMTRNFGHGILWQADPDCILLRDRFHAFSDREVEGLALLAGLSGGVTMTSDHLGELSPERRALWHFVLGDGFAARCNYPLLGAADPVIVQVRPPQGGRRGFLFALNTAAEAQDRRFDLAALGLAGAMRLRFRAWPTGDEQECAEETIAVVLPAHGWRLFEVSELPPMTPKERR